MSSLFSLSSAVLSCIVSLSMDFVIGPLRVSNYSVSWNSLPMANLSVGVIAKRLCPAELLWYLWIYYIFSKCLLVRNFWVFYIQLVSGVRNLFPSSFRHWRIPKTDFLVILIAFFVISLHRSSCFVWSHAETRWKQKKRRYKRYKMTANKGRDDMNRSKEA